MTVNLNQIIEEGTRWVRHLGRIDAFSTVVSVCIVNRLVDVMVALLRYVGEEEDAF